MNRDYVLHPERGEENVEGAFYTLSGVCLDCDLPEEEAPTLLCQDPDKSDTFFVKQPETKEEIQQACEAIRVCCTNALRYGGKNPEIISQLNNDPEYCDFNLEGKLNLKPSILGGNKYSKWVQLTKLWWLNRNT